MYKNTLVVNFFGGPCAGKSTMSGALFAEMKWKGYDTEYVQEYAKDKVWEKSLHTLDNQIYVFGKQNFRMFRVNKKVEIIITDSSIINSVIYYQGDSSHFLNLVVEEFKSMNTLNIFLDRDGHYNDHLYKKLLKLIIR